MDTRQPSTDAAPRTYILFGVAGTTYALSSQQVRHMEMVEQITAVPNAAPFVEGVVFSRGEVVPVVNLRVRFGFERVAHDLRSRLMVVNLAGRTIGLLVDDAREFVMIPDASVQPPSDAIGDLSSNYLEGIATIANRIVLIVNLTHLLDAVPSAA
jgi:chemotaxis signal transduction protein